MDIDKLKEREDRGSGAVRELRESEKWAALQFLVVDLGLTITQVNISDKKIQAFRKEGA